MPARLISPTVGFTVTRPFCAAGDNSEPEVSVPIAAAHSPAATATADPELDPPGETSGTPRVVDRVGGIGIADLTAERAVPGRHVDREDVRELGQVGLAEDDRAGRAQQRHQRRIARSARLGQRQRTGRRVHAVAGRDVVLYEDRYAGERAMAAQSSAVAGHRVGERVGVDLAHRVEPRPGPVIRLDARQISAGQRLGGDAPRRQRLLQLGE